MIYWYDSYGFEDLVAIVDNPNKWLEENNQQRKKDGEEPETLDEFIVKKVNMNKYLTQ
jgi:hypothetical protein